MSNTIILGIAGGTGSGKTTMVREISLMLGGGITVIPADAYYYDRSDMTEAERNKVNYDHPDALEVPLLCEHIRMLKEGKAIERPVYDFYTHTRKKETVHIDPTEIIILEGILIFAIPELRNLIDIRIFVDTDSDERLMRRIIRDVMESSGWLRPSSRSSGRTGERRPAPRLRRPSDVWASLRSSGRTRGSGASISPRFPTPTGRPSS